MTFDEAAALLRAHGQAHVLDFSDRLDAAGRQALADQVATLDFDMLATMQVALHDGTDAAAPDDGLDPAPVTGCDELAERDSAEGLTAAGCEHLADGKVGVILVAGGQGSRLGYEGPKGCYPVGPVSGASLFEIHARKILALERAYAARIPFYIMTSAANDAATRDFFESNGYFGLDADRVRFFTQGMWPALWPDGRLLTDAPGHIFMSPDGHGGMLRALRCEGMFDDMRARGIETLFYFQVDNPLVEVADPRLIGLHVRAGADIAIKVCAKRDPGEGLGVVALASGRARIVEYTELTEAQQHARGPDGELRFRFGSVAIHVFARAFLEQEADRSLPLHRARKKIPYCDESGRTVKPDTPNGCKFEQFIFDTVPDAAVSLNVEFRREDEFAPVKNASGDDSPATCRQAQIEKAARRLEQAGVQIPRDADGLARYAVEIDPCYAADPAALADRVAGLVVTGDLLLRDG